MTTIYKITRRMKGWGGSVSNTPTPPTVVVTPPTGYHFNQLLPVIFEDF